MISLIAKAKEVLGNEAVHDFIKALVSLLQQTCIMPSPTSDGDTLPITETERKRFIRRVFDRIRLACKMSDDDVVELAQRRNVRIDVAEYRRDVSEGAAIV
jgi:hypothetical protein